MKKILLVILTALMLTACSDSKPVAVDPYDIMEPVQNRLGETIGISRTFLNYDEFELMGQCYVENLAGGEREACVSLRTTAQRDKTGKMMWDDSQEWALDVATEKGCYVLFDQRINGRAYMNIYKAYNEGSEENVISLYILGNTYNEVREYRFNGESFIETISYTTDEVATEGISEIYSSFPDYE